MTTTMVTMSTPATPSLSSPSPSIRSHLSRRLTNRMTNRYSVNAMYSLAAEQDVDIEDDLARAQKRLRELKARISSQSKKNFVLERDVRYLDSRIALLIQNRMAADEKRQVAETLEEVDEESGLWPDEKKMGQLVSLSEIDTLLQTVMFTLYGNQYEQREEHLLLTMFQSVLSAQFETTSEFGSLLRANTPVSRMMTTYTRRGPGQSYLKSVLADRINSLIEHKDLNLEINPLKVYDQMIQQIEEDTGSLPPSLPRGVAPEVAAANPDVQAIIIPRITMLMEIANSFLATIMDSIESVPYGIRWICKQIRSLTRRKHPDASDASICSLIGGFFFLRFINPAIVTPQAYMLVDGVPAKYPRRTLTLIAKMLQNLANKPSYAKEQYMMSLNPFVENNKVRMNKFLNALCEVGDFYESLELDQYMALSKKDLQINITLNELYNTHSLLMQHMDVLSPNDQHHLRILLDELGPAPAQVPRKENRSIELPLFSRWETPIQDLSTSLMADSVTQNDINYMEAKAIFVQLLRSMPTLADKRPINLPALAEKAATSNDPVLVRRGIKVQALLSELDGAEASAGAGAGGVGEMNEYGLMQDEVAAEMVHLGNTKEKVVLECRFLESVYKTICDHNSYLRSQLEQYKAYLQNVRLTSSKEKGASGVGVVTVNGKEKKQAKNQVLGPYRFTHAHAHGTSEHRRMNIYFNITSPAPGTFIIALHFKGRDKPILEMDLKIDDLLEKQKDHQASLDLEYVQLNVPKVLTLFNKLFSKRR
ncbi:hypothetical protein D1P53_000781 [Cryptococcus gattii VGV]|nr:hypothetical protein D1P53_000781 [Cryptococcus gattii VGV]